MKSSFAHYLGATALAAVVMSGPTAAQTAAPPERLTHRPIELLRNADGSIKRGLRNEIQTGYWSGFAVTAAAPYTSASGTFQVPSVSYSGSGHSYEDSALWVGIGGDGDSTLIQLGTEQLITSSGAASYYVWYELYPAATVYLGHAVKPGDIIAASLQCTAACSPSSVQTWQLTMTDETAGWSWTQNVQYQSSMASAEWITEAPWDSSGELPLDDFVQATFDPVSANGVNRRAKGTPDRRVKRTPAATDRGCPGSEQEGPARVAKCPHERRSGARGRCLFAPVGNPGVGVRGRGG